MSSTLPDVQSRSKGDAALRGPTTAIGALTLNPPCRAVYITGNGNIVGKLIGDSSDSTFSGLLTGAVYKFAFKSITSATATGFVLY